MPILVSFFYNFIEKMLGKILFGKKLLPLFSTARELVKNLKVCFLSLSFAVLGQLRGAAIFLVWRAITLAFSLLGDFFYLSIDKKIL
ncbi:MAG: hypothetical protein LBD73_01935, partial [Deferribacteraceae bacterium]|nr:hypothetical protein [Deferribacteraceae bacterium]